MKKWRIVITPVFILLFILIISFFVTSCAPPIVRKFDDSQFNAVTDQIAELDRLECINLRNKKIFTNFTVSQQKEYFLEDFDLSEGKVKKIKYEGDIGEDIKRQLDRVLINCCGSVIENEKAQADITINADVEKYYSQVLDYKKKGDESLAGISGEKGIDVKGKASSILSITNRINNDNEDWKYNHLLSLTRTRTTKVNRSGVFLVKTKRELMVADGFIVDYDDEYTLVTGSVVSTTCNRTLGPFMVKPSFDIKGNLDIYDIDRMTIKKHLTLEECDFEKKWSGTVMKKEKKAYFDLYGSTNGNLQYLIYDYIKELIYKINREKQK